MYKLLAKYEYDGDVDARVPAIMAPVALTRDGVVVADVVLARTARFERAAFCARAVTPRDGVVVCALMLRTLARGETVLDATPRDVVVRDADAGVTVARDTVERATVALFAFARGLVRPNLCGNVFAGATGSANTERIDINVEQTKNAAANKNTVPIAFFKEFAFIRKFMIFSCLNSCAKTADFPAILHKIFLYLIKL